MDIVSHGLWGGIAFGRKSKRSYWTSFFFGIMPDLFSFGILTVANLLGLSARPDWSSGVPASSAIPLYVHELYDITHSLIVFALVFGLVWIVRKRPFWPLAAWGLHVFMDIFTHSMAFFPTPFLWPVSAFRVNGINWGEPLIFFPDWAFLGLTYTVWLVRARKRRREPI